MIVALLGIGLSLPFLSLTIACIDRHRSRSGIQELRWMAFCEFAAAWFLGLMFLSGGLSKLMPFPGVMGPVWLEEVLAPHGLATYARFIAWSETVIGLFLLSRTTRVMGAIMMVPLLTNILMVTISMSWRGTPWIIMIFLSANLFLLAFHFRRWQPLIDVSGQWLAVHNRVSTTLFRLVQATGILLILIAPALYLVSTPVTVVAVLAGLGGLVWGEIKAHFVDPVH